MAQVFEEVCNAEGLIECQCSLEAALKDYDAFIFACQILDSGESIKTISSFRPQFEIEIQTHSTSHKDYDSFSINNFYNFCKADPSDPSNSEFKYPFCELDRSYGLDQIVE